LAGEWTSPERALEYLARADAVPHRGEGEAVLLELLPERVGRILDVGAGDGRVLHLVKLARPTATGVALDLSPTMLSEARRRFEDEESVEVVEHDLNHRLPAMGSFDAVVSSMAIHHLVDERKRTLYEEIFDLLEPGGVFLNLERVASPTPNLRRRFRAAMGHDHHTDHDHDTEDLSDRLLDLDTQLYWLREIGFADVDCYWKWLELALLGGVKPERGT
jgi:tRNA (cmo5U34)-methyltransferase